MERRVDVEKKEMSLVERAKAIRPGTRSSVRNVTPGEIELAVAFIEGKIGQHQIMSVLSINGSQTAINWVTTTLRLGVVAGFLSLTVDHSRSGPST